MRKKLRQISNAVKEGKIEEGDDVNVYGLPNKKEIPDHEGINLHSLLEFLSSACQFPLLSSMHLN